MKNALKGHGRSLSQTQDISIRLRPLQRFVHLALGALLLWSMLTESTFFLALFYGLSEQWLLAICLTILLVALLEGGKLFFGSYVLRLIIRGWFKENWIYRVALAFLLPVAVLLFYSSIYLSVQGAPNIAAFATSQNQTLVLIDIDSIQQQFDNRLAQLQQDKQQAHATQWKGVMTVHATKLALRYQEQIHQLENQRDTALHRAIQANTELKNTHQSETTNWGAWLAKLGGIAEAITLLLLLFLELYYHASLLEQSKLHSTEIIVEPVEATLNAKQLAYLKQRAQQCYQRAQKTSSKEETRAQNLAKAKQFIAQLAQQGIQTTMTSNPPRLLFHSIQKPNS